MSNDPWRDNEHEIQPAPDQIKQEAQMREEATWDEWKYGWGANGAMLWGNEWEDYYNST